MRRLYWIIQWAQYDQRVFIRGSKRVREGDVTVEAEVIMI